MSSLVNLPDHLTSARTPFPHPNCTSAHQKQQPNDNGKVNSGNGQSPVLRKVVPICAYIFAAVEIKNPTFCTLSYFTLKFICEMYHYTSLPGVAFKWTGQWFQRDFRPKPKLVFWKNQCIKRAK